MSMNDDYISLSSILTTKASEELDQAVEEELNIPDPENESADTENHESDELDGRGNNKDDWFSC